MDRGADGGDGEAPAEARPTADGNEYRWHSMS
jgi:hypothetical protein